MKIPGPNEIGTVLAGVMAEGPSPTRTEALRILQQAMNKTTVSTTVAVNSRGPLPENLTFHHVPDGHEHSLFAVHHPTGVMDDPNEPDRQYAGHISWFDGGHVYDLATDPQFLRRGVATELWRRAREIDPRIQHAPEEQTPDGMAWAATTASTRVCERCGARMAPRWPRQRVGEQMWCPSCVQNASRMYGRRHIAEIGDEYDEPVHYRDFGDVFRGITPYIHSDEMPQPPRPSPRKRRRGIPGRWPYNEDLGEHKSIEKFEPVPFEQRQNGMPMHTLSSRYAVRTGIGTLPLDAPPQQGLAYFVAADKPHIIRLAHDSGSTEIIYHCPFCGSGQVVARSDGTVECQFCQAAFTVQVQPEFSAFPQTIDGMPVDIPGMGGTSQNPDVPPGQEPDGAAAAPTDVPGGSETQPPEEGEDDASEDEPEDEGGNPLFNKKSYRTASGATVDRDAYIRHLALGITTRRGRVLAYMRGERGDR